MLRDVYLYGEPGRTFGRHFQLAVDTPHEAIRALQTLRPGTRKAFQQGHWRIIVGTPHIKNSVVEMNMNMGSQPLHIVPCTRPHGGDGGFGKIALGVVAIGAAIVLSPFTGGGSLAAAMSAPALFGTTTFGGIALMGGALVLGGVASMLSPKPPQQQGTPQQATDMARPEDRPSFLFNGTVNNTQQGGPVPLIIGEHLVGSVVISGALMAEDVPA